MDLENLKSQRNQAEAFNNIMKGLSKQHAEEIDSLKKRVADKQTRIEELEKLLDEIKNNYGFCSVVISMILEKKSIKEIYDLLQTNYNLSKNKAALLLHKDPSVTPDARKKYFERLERDTE